MPHLRLEIPGSSTRLSPAEHPPHANCILFLTPPSPRAALWLGYCFVAVVYLLMIDLLVVALPVLTAMALDGEKVLFFVTLEPRVEWYKSL